MCPPRIQRFLLLASLIVMATVYALSGGAGETLASPAPARSVTPAIACQPGVFCVTPMQIVSSPDVSEINNALSGITAISASDIWAVGYAGGDSGLGCRDSCQTLTEHWNGAMWSVVTTPNAGVTNELNGVAAIATNDVWAVGDSVANGIRQPLIEHWNGSAWSVVSTPNDGSQLSYLSSVAAVSATDVWAVGTISGPYYEEPLVEHWDGSNWSIVPCPSLSGDENYLTGITAISATDIWAVGYSYTGGSSLTLIEHWNGTVWGIVSSPNPSSLSNLLRGVSATSSTDVWAVGSHAVTGQNANATLVEHWNGTAWSVVASPNERSNENDLDGVAALSASNVWVVGTYSAATANQALIERWNGANWTIATSPNVGTCNNILAGVSAVSSSQVWAVGTFGVGPGGENTDTLTEQFAPFPIL